MKNSDPVVFYSWQSDHSKTRYFIEEALQKAIDNLSEDPTLELAPRFDKDLKGKVGAINVPVNIRKKIDAASIFVADLTLVDKGKTGRDLVNQNVMYELGYAAGKLGEEATVILLNKDLADKKLLPFDIAQNRVEDFSIKEDKDGSKLVKSLEYILKAHLDEIKGELDEAEAASLKDKLLQAVEDGKPARRLAEKYFDDLYKRYIALYPGRYERQDQFEDYAKETYDAYATTLPLSEEFYEVIATLTEYKQQDALLASLTRLEALSRNLDLVPADGNWLHHISKEFYGLVIYELVSIILGCVVKEKWWAIIGEIAKVRFKRGSEYDKPRTLERLYYFPEYTLKYFKGLTGHSYHSPSSILVRDRLKAHEDMLQSYIDGCFLLWSITGNYPWMAGFVIDEDASHNYQPSFISEFKKASFVRILADADGTNDIDQYKEGLWGYAQTSLTGWSSQKLVRMFKAEGIDVKEDIGVS